MLRCKTNQETSLEFLTRQVVNQPLPTTPTSRADGLWQGPWLPYTCQPSSAQPQSGPHFLEGSSGKSGAPQGLSPFK